MNTFQANAINVMRAIHLVKCVQSVRERWTDRWSAEPCLAMRSLQVLRSSTLLFSVRRVDCTSELREPAPWLAAGEVESSPESSAGKKRNENCETETPKCAFLCYSQMWFPFQLTRLGLHAGSFGFGQLQCCDPPLPLHFWAGLQVIRLRAAIRDDEIAWVFHCDIGCGQVYSAPTCVSHLRLGPGRAKGTEIRWCV